MSTKPVATKWDAVLFDLDGTLLDTAPDFIVVLNAMRTDRGRAPLPTEDIRAVVSNGARALVALGFPEQAGDAAAIEALNVELRDRYAQHLAVHTRLFPGLDELLLALEARGVPWGIVTNKPSIYTLPLLDALQLSARCASVVCPDQVTHTKPHPEPMYKACAEMKVDAARCVYVGDHERDIAAGRNAGMATVVAGWGYIGEHERPQDWHPDFIADSVRELRQLLTETLA
ncbi:MAG: phosphoglycolate phosphatase [Gammaproteobacteria bacterium]